MLFADIHIFLKTCKVQIGVKYNYYVDLKQYTTSAQRNPCTVLQGATILVKNTANRKLN